MRVGKTKHIHSGAPDLTRSADIFPFAAYSGKGKINSGDFLNLDPDLWPCMCEGRDV